MPLEVLFGIVWWQNTTIMVYTFIEQETTTLEKDNGIEDPTEEIVANCDSECIQPAITPGISIIIYLLECGVIWKCSFHRWG